MCFDCALLVYALGGALCDYSEFERIIEDYMEYMGDLGSIKIQHVFHETNGVAHRLAHNASCSSLYEVWFDKTASIIKDVLYENMCNVARGSGFMSPS